MGYNIYAQIPKLKAQLQVMGYSKDYPKSVFGIALMLTFGMGKKRAIDWITNFEVAEKIVIKDNVINFKEGV